MRILGANPQSEIRIPKFFRSLLLLGESIYIAVKTHKESSVEVEMKIRGLMMDPITNMPIVILKEAAGSGILPIWVGVYEANAIALEIEKVVTPRPMTHDLLKNVLVGLDACVQKVVVTCIKEDTFYALIW